MSTLTDLFVVDLVCVLRPTVMAWGWRCSCGSGRNPQVAVRAAPLSARASRTTREIALDDAARHAQDQHFGHWQVGVDVMVKR